MNVHGIKITLGALIIAAALSAASMVLASDKRISSPVFNRIASFPVYLNTDIEEQTVAEIVDVSKDGNTLVYTDGKTEKLGFVDIKKPADPQPLGAIDVGGEPTSVAVAGKYALVAVNTSLDFVNTSGDLVVINIKNQTIVATHPLDGQPDSIAVSPDGRYAAIAIENERDEDLGDGEPAQAPPGFLVIVDIKGKPSDWGLREVDLKGIADEFPDDPEPEYVDINRENIAVITLQENNHIVLVDLQSGAVKGDFGAGSVDLSKIDIVENDLIELIGSQDDVPREADGVTWINNHEFVTADEGDLFGGSRGFTIYNTDGRAIFTSGNSNDHHVARLGHYPEDRSENKGNEPENAEFGKFGRHNYLFIGSERSNVVFVYRLRNNGDPELIQTLPAGVGPEGLKAIPKRKLFVAASEKDERGDKYRSVLNIYQLQKKSKPAYPTIVSSNRSDGTPIPWGALSGLAGSKEDAIYAIHDSFYNKSRIYSMDAGSKPAIIKDELVLQDSMGKLAAVNADMVNGDNTVNIDAEGIALRAGGGFWIASEGKGTVGDADRPFETLNLILGVTRSGDIDRVIELPGSTNVRQVRFGFEGVASTGNAANEVLYVAFQREWADDPAGQVRIGRYEITSSEWTFYYYPLEMPESSNGGWVGLSEITALGPDRFAVIERDNQGSTDAAIKRIYAFSVAGLRSLADPAAGTTPTFPIVSKRLVRDLIPDLQKPNGQIPDKVEGMTMLRRGTTLVVNDNDGVDDSNGETQLLRLKSHHRR